MTDIILHHYDGSPYANKIRKILGFKGQAWNSVIIPEIMPKPDLTVLTGGYRMTPVMQIGANIYCDSYLITSVLDRLYPEPALYPSQHTVSIKAIDQWANDLFMPAITIIIGLGGIIGDNFLEDRNNDVMPEKLDQALAIAKTPACFATLEAGMAELEQQLSDGRPYLLGNEITAADFAAEVSASTLFLLPVFESLVEGSANIGAWMGRMAEIQPGERTEIGSKQALAIARKATPVVDSNSNVEWEGLACGDTVQVLPKELGLTPVEGELVINTAHEIAVRRQTEYLGDLVVHFPRAHSKITKV